jgi:hypothetical protein
VVSVGSSGRRQQSESSKSEQGERYFHVKAFLLLCLSVDGTKNMLKLIYIVSIKRQSIDSPHSHRSFPIRREPSMLWHGQITER